MGPPGRCTVSVSSFDYFPTLAGSDGRAIPQGSYFLSGVGIRSSAALYAFSSTFGCASTGGPDAPLLLKPWGYAGSVSNEMTVAATIRVLIAFVTQIMCLSPSMMAYRPEGVRTPCHASRT